MLWSFATLPTFLLMETSLAVLFIAVVGLAAFLLGRAEPAGHANDKVPDPMHPATYPVMRWRQSDPVAVAEWLKTQPSDAPWIQGIPVISH